MMARMILALAICSAALAATPAAAQDGNTEASPTPPLASPAPYDSSTGSISTPTPKEAPVAEGKAPENLPVEGAPQSGAATESKPAENAEGRFTFSRMNDGYVRLDNRTGQVSFCSKRTVGWTCQLAPEDRGVLENEIARLQEENASLKKELLARGLPLPGSMKGEPPVVHNERTFSLPSDPNIDRMKLMVEKAWRRLVDMISALQKDVLKKS
jgi:hypothetical protein